MDSPARLWQRLRANPRRRDAVEAGAVAVAGLGFIALGVVDNVGPLPPFVPDWLADPWWHAVPLLLGCLALLAKRHRPLTVTVVVVVMTVADAVIGGSLGVYLVLIDALYHLVVYCPRPWVRPTIGVVAVWIGLGTVVAFVLTGDLRIASFALIQLFAILGTPVWWALSVRQQSELAELASARADDLHRLSDLHRARAVQDERARMAQDLHDALSSHLSTIAIHSGAALSSRDKPVHLSAEDQQAALREIRGASVRALADLREMIQLLRTGQDEITPAAHVGDIEPLLAAARGTGLQVVLETDLTRLPRLPSVVDQAAYRIVQESLANAIKHAPGSTVRVSVEACPRERRLRLDISCRPGTTTVTGPPGSGLGLTTMRDRAATLAGTFHAGWEGDGPGRSWVVRADLPLEEMAVH